MFKNHNQFNDGARASMKSDIETNSRPNSSDYMGENEESRHVREDYNYNMLNDGRSSSESEFDEDIAT